MLYKVIRHCQWRALEVLHYRDHTARVVQAVVVAQVGWAAMAEAEAQGTQQTLRQRGQMAAPDWQAVQAALGFVSLNGLKMI
jgi:hypothetical protein